jgi:uncharacterized linocin/CFP29 family protein
MTDNCQVPWTDEQWARVDSVIQEEASRARVAATFLPLVGPLSADADFVRRGDITYPELEPQRPETLIAINDTATMLLATLQVKVFLRGAQMADPEMTSALALFRRAANILARLEDAVVFRGLPANPPAPPPAFSPPPVPADFPLVWEIVSGEPSDGLVGPPAPAGSLEVPVGGPPPLGDLLVAAIANAIGRLEGRGQFGPFAVVLDHNFFAAVQTPAIGLTLPQDRIIPFLGSGGSLLRSSMLPENRGVVVALGGAPVELVVATDMSQAFLQVTSEPRFLFRVFEKIRLRINQPQAIAILV